MKDKKALDIQVGCQIKKAREAAGYTQDRFAEIIGMGTKNVSAIERGVVGVSLSSIKKICEALCISSDTLLLNKTYDEEVEQIDVFMERLKRLPRKQFELVMDINNKLFEAFALQGKT